MELEFHFRELGFHFWAVGTQCWKQLNRFNPFTINSLCDAKYSWHVHCSIDVRAAKSLSSFNETKIGDGF